MNANRVTLLMIDGGNCPELSARTIMHCRGMLPWGAARLYTYDLDVAEYLDDVALHRIPELSWPQGAWDFKARWLPTLFAPDTTHVLYMQPDGYIIHPEQWDDAWLKYDLVAPPWPAKMVRDGDPRKCRVGCGGFCLQSRQFAQAVRALVVGRGYRIDRPLDVWECQTQRDRLEKEYDMSYAPCDVAIRFGVEHRGDEWADWLEEDSFGFHDVGLWPGRRLL